MTASPPTSNTYTSLEEREGVAMLALHAARGNALPLNLVLLRELERRLQEVEEAAAPGNARLLLIQTCPSHPAVTGYDLEEIRALTGPGIFEWSQEAQTILRRLEQLSIPTVAVVRGDWTGGAAELALACSHRVAAAAPEARFSLPQTRRGLIPAWGGTVRLPRLIGLHRALRLVLSAEPVSAKEALEIGLVDQLIPVAEFEERLWKYALALAEGAEPKRGSSSRDRSTHGSRRRRRVSRRLVEDTAPGRRLLAARASRRYLSDASATLATRLALELMVESSALPLAEAFDRESRVASELIITNETRGRLHSERVTELATQRTVTNPSDPDSSAVVGAGQTGSDLAYLLLCGGGPVRIKDRREAARTGVARTRGRIAWDVRQERISEDEGKHRSAMVEGVTGFGGFGLLDVAVVAADGTPHRTEELAVGLEPHIREDCLLAVHDWSLPIAELQKQLTFPERVIGVTPAFPIDRYPLLEIVPGPRTSSDSVTEARRLAQQCGLTPVVVGEPAPTPGVRLLSVFLAEATRLLRTGLSIETIDAAIEEFGFSAGPFRRIDAMGSRRAARMLTRVGERLGDRAAPAEPFSAIAESGETFYRYRGGRAAGMNPRLPAETEAPREELVLMIRRRILLLLINEAASIIEDGSIADAADVDLISILALGFPRERGGLLYYAQDSGLPGIAEDLRAEALRSGPYFAPAGLLDRLAREGRGFFSDPPAHSGHDSDAVLQ